jgi:RNA polymerase sigma factor (sigma-70 family)
VTEGERRSAEADLLRQAAAGDPASVRALLDLAGPVVYGYVVARVGGHQATAEDIVQDTFLEAVRSAPTFRGDAALTTWLCAIARRRLFRHYEAERKQEAARRGLEVIEGGASGAPGRAAPAPSDAVDERDEVVRALGRLPVLHRQVLVLKYLDGRAVAEIADELGRSRVQVQSLLQRARDNLRRELEVSA